MAPKKKILVVDDEQTMRQFLLASLSSRYDVTCAGDGQEALETISENRYDLVLSDIQMPRMGGLELLDGIRDSVAVPPPVILMTAFGTVEQAVKATRNGAIDYLCKPFGLEQLDHALERAWNDQVIRAELAELRGNIAERSRRHGLLGNHTSMVRLREQIRTIADSRGTVLIQGESGTGKEVVARAIHDAGRRAEGPFIRLNCAAIPETLLESELFGYERGAFTGANERRSGKFALADGGTLLLDEISELPYAMQAKLLRVLQEREFMPLGAQYPSSSDVRIIATTNRDLPEEIQLGRFREDLFYRLNVVPLTMPPLRHRKEDIPLLAGHFCQNFCAENGKPLMAIEPAALARLQTMDWPGNVRQLQNVIERAVILGSGETLSEKDLGLSGEMNATSRHGLFSADLTLKDMERELILRKLRRTAGNRTRAAGELGISVRTLRNKLNLYHAQGVEIPE